MQQLQKSHEYTVYILLGHQVLVRTDRCSLENIPDNLMPMTSVLRSLQCKTTQLQRSDVKVIQNPRSEIPVAVSLAPFHKGQNMKKNIQMNRCL